MSESKYHLPTVSKKASDVNCNLMVILHLRTLTAHTMGFCVCTQHPTEGDKVPDETC